MTPVHNHHDAHHLEMLQSDHDGDYGNSSKHSMGSLLGSTTTNSTNTGKRMLPNAVTNALGLTSSPATSSSHGRSASEASTTSSHTSVDHSSTHEYNVGEEEDGHDSAMLARVSSIEVTLSSSSSSPMEEVAATASKSNGSETKADEENIQSTVVEALVPRMESLPHQSTGEASADTSSSSFNSQMGELTGACSPLPVPEAPEHHTISEKRLRSSSEEEKVEEDTDVPASNTAPPSPSTAATAAAAARPLQRSKRMAHQAPMIKHHSSGDSWDMQEEEEAHDALTGMKAAPGDINNPLQRSNELPKKLSLNSRRSVEFSHVHIREYNVAIGDNPCCSYGPPITLDWDYNDDQGDIPLDVYEQNHLLVKHSMKRRARRSLVLNYTERRARLWRAGYSLEEIDAAAKELERLKWRQSMLGNLEAFYRLQEAWVLYVKPVVFPKERKRQEMNRRLDFIEQKVRDEHSSRSLALSETVSIPHHKEDDDHVIEMDDDDLEFQAGGVPQAIVIEGLDGLMDQEQQREDKEQAQQQHQPGSSSDAQNNGVRREPSSGSSGDNSGNSHNNYGIRVDKKQQDKATEIILCSLRRPHMRAFHASWFSFFAAFFAWFAITPLLGEVQETLNLDKADIWMSSLFGTAGTIVFRIVMGPACDAFGARLCMAFILVAAAIPTALTGLVQSSAGLSLVRLFIGIGGASFVACQYWTSEMFSRETAGTANALVAGWGNFGGGVANLVMGSALFPLLRWFFRGRDEDEDDDALSSELAWRTVFVVPALLSIATALMILLYCDDSPKGSYRDRIKSESLTKASPMESLKKSARNWNVWILTFQYACCFGVEVTMTNATALYFKDEFGQSTVSAAGIASIFGLMNLWARGLGGLGSDKCQNMKGVKGRLFWQMFTLIFEGIGVGLFAIADSLAASIIALIFLSCMVQSAEGSTFGIVPYVDRRFTGSVVGIVGSGGNAGAAVFSVFFVLFSYRAGFMLMGLAAIGSSFLSFLMKTDKLAQTHDTVALEVEQREQQEEEDRILQNDNSRSHHAASYHSANLTELPLELQQPKDRRSSNDEEADVSA
ncbi:affinity nitrate transporter 2 [Seminavis robusta]|uniref:Affinity nitrate transporter 2 n=1 Tax=Seminavis robusta TaxID=568900 RepID=A0A9N8H2K2_9STRA|nr:affinity nitrate transporter 2 [Seminavis robusta]|eukprot:Sro20_g014200.1 affinity nitrate transporter 2 (1066) ;mRNA; f:107896-111268